MFCHDKQVMFKASYCRHIPVSETTISIAYNFVSPFYLNRCNMGSRKNIQSYSLDDPPSHQPMTADTAPNTINKQQHVYSSRHKAQIHGTQSCQECTSASLHLGTYSHTHTDSQHRAEGAHRTQNQILPQKQKVHRNWGQYQTWGDHLALLPLS